MREHERSIPPIGSELTPGTRVGDHVIDGALAAGGFGVVHRAKHGPTGQLRAVKVLHPEVAASPEAVARLEREADLLRQLAHPNVLVVHEVGRIDEGRPYLVTELLHGADLETVLRRRGRLPVEEVLAIIGPLVDALGAAHERGIVHRDVKASNVFIDERGGVPRIVLLDFGVAKLLDPSTSSLTSTRRRVGSPSCMAPEQIRGRATDARADVYALGVLTFQLLAGEPPFHGDSFVQTEQLHLFARPPAVSARAPADPALDAVITRAMSKDPALRQPTAAAFLAELLAATGDAREAREVALVAVHVEIFTSPGALDDPDDALLSDHGTIFALAVGTLGEAGLEVAVETGNTLLMVKALGPSAPEEQTRAIAAALEASRRIEARVGRDERVATAIAVHAGAARRVGPALDGAAVDTAAWAPRAPTKGVLATREALTGVCCDLDPQAAADGLLAVVRLEG
jgi:serine/threonine-protein kinase